MMPANNYGGFSQSSDTLTQSDDEALQALALQVMAENLTPQQTEAIYALLQDEWTQQPEQKPTPQPTAQADPQRSTQQGAAGNLPLESMASAYGTLQHESMHPMQQAHQSTKEAHDLLPEIEEALSHMPLQQQDHEWITSQISRWKSQQQEYHFLESIFYRGMNSPTITKRLFFNKSRTMKSLQFLNNEVINQFEEIKKRLSCFEFDGVTQVVHEMDRIFPEIDLLQKRLALDFQKAVALTKNAEAERADDLQKAIAATAQRNEKLGTLLHENELMQAFATDFQPENRAELEARQKYLQLEHTTLQVAWRRHQRELQSIQAPWPESHPGPGAQIEPQPGPSTHTKTKTQPSPPRER